MHWLVNRAIKEFLSETHGETPWVEAVTNIGEESSSITLRDNQALVAAAQRLNRQPVELCEDLGAWLARQEPIRRLLRFSGRHFTEFVQQLDELPGRTGMVIPELAIPEIEISSVVPDQLLIALPSGEDSWAALIAGMLRAMADDYGVLGLILCEGSQISVQVPDSKFSAGREFCLGAALTRRDRA